MAGHCLEPLMVLFRCTPDRGALVDLGKRFCWKRYLAHTFASCTAWFTCEGAEGSGSGTEHKHMHTQTSVHQFLTGGRHLPFDALPEDLTSFWAEKQA